MKTLLPWAKKLAYYEYRDYKGKENGISSIFCQWLFASLSGVPDYFDRNKISSGGDLSHDSSASLY